VAIADEVLRPERDNDRLDPVVEVAAEVDVLIAR